MALQTFMNSLVAQFKQFYKNLTPTKRISVLAVVVIAISSTMVIVLMVTGRTYTPLFKDIQNDQIATVIQKLKEKNVPFKVEDGGKTILVPPEFVYTTQMSIMTEAGSATLGTVPVGLEIFDKQDFGTTSYSQRVNFQRALQGELIRAINSLEVVKKSKVLLAMPPKKTFLEEGGQPSASVVVDLKPGKSLSRDQIRGISYLVASAVENMDPESVTIVDSRGKVLSRNTGSNVSTISSDLLELRDRIERRYEKQIESILTKVVGQGKVIARVSVDINQRNVTSTEELVDPDKTAVRSVTSEEEKLNGNRTNPVGIPGARANVPGADDAGNVAFRQDVAKELKTTNYAVPKTVRNTKEAPGRVEKISIAVLVDGKTVAAPAAEGEEDQVRAPAWVARDAEELRKYESLIKSAIGYNEKRGDTFSIESIRFEKEDFSESEKLLNTLQRRKLISFLVQWSFIGFILALFFFIVVRPFMRWITDNFQESVDDMLPKTIEELEDLQTVDDTLPGMSSALPVLEESIDPEKAESELLKERIMSLVEENNKKAANALSLWFIRRDL
jgi:flagellar M-ring protein FliF